MEQKKQRMIDELPFWHGQIKNYNFFIFLLEKYKKKKNNITINDRIIDMKKILFLIAKLNIRKMRRKDLKLTFHRIK